MKQLATTAVLYPPPSPKTSITFKLPPRYNKLSKTPKEASRLVISTLHPHPLPTPGHDRLLSFYGLPLPHWLVELTACQAPPLADGLKFELHTLPGYLSLVRPIPVNSGQMHEKSACTNEAIWWLEKGWGANRELLKVDAKAIADGDTVTVYVSTLDARESSRVPHEVQMAAVELNEAQAERNYTKAEALQKQITHAGYRIVHIDNQDILARKYRIRLRGIDAPERSMPYGKEAKDELVKIIEGKRLKILIFGEDRYGRFVGDIYCNGIFVQESLLKKGLAWHYTNYDKRPELEKWEKDARAKRVGLWESSNPEMPWVWRKDRRENRHPRLHV